jgi:hypothetical protein
MRGVCTIQSGATSAGIFRCVEKLRFHCGARTAIFSGMSAILKDEEFVAVEAAVKAGVAPQPVSAAFSV